MKRLLRLVCAIIILAPVIVRAQFKYPPSLEGTREEVYKTVGDTQLRLYVYDREPGAKNRPAIVFFFGGGWATGSPSQFEQHCIHFAGLGMVAITADYRVSSRNHVRPTECLSDAKAAIAFVRNHSSRLGVNPERIAAAGGSAGGHLAAATGTVPGFEGGDDTSGTSSIPNALILFNPALVLAPIEGVDLKGFGTNLDAAKLGAEPVDLSPSHHIREETPPTLMFHGKADSTVPFVTAQAFEKSMHKKGKRCDLIGFDGEGHGFFNYGRGDNIAFKATLETSDSFLKSLGWLKKD